MSHRRVARELPELDLARLPQGYRNLAFDLLTLAAMMRERWSELQGRTALQVNELTHAALLADRLVQAVGAVMSSISRSSSRDFTGAAPED